MRLFKLIAALFIMVFVVDYYRSTPDFNKDECAKDPIHGDVRKITRVRSFIYEYVLPGSDRKLMMRIKDFDKIMVSVSCEEFK